MTDGEASAEDVDGLDAAWDALNREEPNRAAAIDASGAATLRSLRVLADVSPPISRRIWANACALAAPADHGARRRAATPGGRPLHVVAPAPFGWGWPTTRVIAAAACLTILGGILFAGSDGDGISRMRPGDASSVVATLPSSAPAWATPGGEGPD